MELTAECLKKILFTILSQTLFNVSVYSAALEVKGSTKL
jgi:hypothetical protein